MEILKIINTKQLIETATLFEVIDNKPKKIAEVAIYTGKNGYTDYYSIISIFNTHKTEYKKAAARHAYKGQAIAAAAKEMGMKTESQTHARMVLSEIAKQYNIQNPFISEV